MLPPLLLFCTIDNSGFTGLIAAANKPILDYNKAAIAGFGFGIDDFFNTAKDVKAARTLFLRLKHGERRAAISMLDE